jgi:DNA-binding response OmpR family regulator
MLISRVAGLVGESDEVTLPPRAPVESVQMGTHFNIGPLQLDADAQVLIHEGAAVALGARAVAVLTVLVSRANEYVEKSALQIGSPLPPWERSRHETVRLPQGVPPWS